MAQKIQQERLEPIKDLDGGQNMELEIGFKPLKKQRWG